MLTVVLCTHLSIKLGEGVANGEWAWPTQKWGVASNANSSIGSVPTFLSQRLATMLISGVSGTLYGVSGILHGISGMESVEHSMDISQISISVLMDHYDYSMSRYRHNC